MKYMVTVMDTFPEQNTRGCIMETPRRSFGLTLVQAGRVCRRACKRGARMYGGVVQNLPWGMDTQGDNSRAMLVRPVRYATITVDPGRK